MTPIIEDTILGSDLDCQFYDLLNVRSLEPVPPNLATSDHPGLTDERLPLPGSVYDEHVAIDAGIVQSKLNLDGQIPPAWLGTSPGTAAQGDLAEYLANKDQPGGYAGLDSTGKIPSVRLPDAAGAGTVTSVGLTMPASFGVTGTPVTGAGTLQVQWAPVLDLSWFGNKEGIAGPPQFYNTPLPPTLIPSLDASVVTSGVFDPARLPVAVGIGLSHASGAVPSPGAGTGPGENATDYLARDMTFKPMSGDVPTVLPVLKAPKLVADRTVEDPVSVIVSLVEMQMLGDPPVSTEVNIEDAHHVFFYEIAATPGYKEFPPEKFVHVTAPATVHAYCAHAGMENSPVTTLTLA
jgi:hypothetical protein